MPERVRQAGPIRLVLADDHALVLDGMRTVIGAVPDLHVVATATDGERALEAVHRFKPEVLVLDLQMPHMDGLSCLARVKAEVPDTRVLVLSAFADGPSLRRAIESGADGYALKTDPPDATIRAIRGVASGALVFPAAARHLLGTARDAHPDALTEREEAVLRLLAEGRSNAEIAAAIQVSANTVKFHLRNLYAKLGVRNRTEAVARLLNPRN